MFRKKVYLFPVLILLVCLLAVFSASAEDLVTLQYDVTYEYTMARDVFPLVNDFRTNGTPWQLDTDNVTQVPVPGLQALTYDEELEKVAMQRAAELAIHFAHTRPNNEDCFSIYPNSGWKGENIAAGQTSAEEVYLDWREDDCDYDHQGHRRNMLNSNFTRIGVGCVKANGRYYWCQSFGSDPNFQSSVVPASPAVNQASLSILTNEGSGHSLSNAFTSAESIRMNENSSVDVPAVGFTVKHSWRSTPVTMASPVWTCSEAVVTISSSKITGVSGGKGTLNWTLGDLSLSVPVTVICKTIQL